MSRRRDKPVALRRLIGICIAICGIALGVYASTSDQSSTLFAFGSFALMVIGVGVAGVKAENIA